MKLFASWIRSMNYIQSDLAPQVVLLFVCDTFNSAFDVAFLYIPLVADYGTLFTNWSLVLAHTERLIGNVNALTRASWG